MNLEDKNLVGCNTNEKDDHIFRCHETIRMLKKAYRLAHNSAAGLTNYCEESASTRRCEEELEHAEMVYNQMLDQDSKSTSGSA